MTPTRRSSTLTRLAQLVLLPVVAFGVVGCGAEAGGSLGTWSAADAAAAGEGGSSDAPSQDSSDAPSDDASDSGSDAGSSDSGAALRQFVDASQASVAKEMERYADQYEGFSLEAEGDNTVVYRYTFKQRLDPAVAKKQIETSKSLLETTAKNSVFPAMEAAGVENPAAKWVYQNPGGEVITTIEVTS